MSENQRNFQLLFPTVIQKAMVEDHITLNEQLRHEVDEVRGATPNGRPQSWSCDVYTTIGNNFMLHERPGFRGLRAHFLEQAERYGQLLDYPMDKYAVQMDMCWLNAYRQRQSQERHTHINYVFGGIYYLCAPRGASKLIVHSPTADIMIVPEYGEKTELNQSFIEIEPREGLMLIFSGNLRHGVATSDTEQERISISMNATLAERT